MAISLDDPLSEPPAPRGVRLRTMDPERDALVAHAVLDSAFSDHWNHVELSFEDWWAAVNGDSGLDPELWLIAESDEAVAGVLAGSVRDGVGWVDDLGVLRDHRRKGIGEFLLGSSFVVFKERGIDAVKLNVDSDSQTRATALYERVGMTVVSGFDVYEKWVRLDAASRPSKA
jgi:mycothiol synthase